MVPILQIIVVLALLILLILFVFKPKRIKEIIPLPDHYKLLLNEHVKYYQRLDEEEKKNFEERVQKFLTAIRISGVNTTVEDIDRVFIGAGAIIPVHAFPDWEYVNLHEVLLYPGTFNEDFEQKGLYRSISGMVGSGALQNVMIISKSELREGFIDNSGSRNTAIHEFAHLIDKMDGSMDGIPEIVLEQHYIVPWLNIMSATIRQMKTDGSDIDMYGATNQAEFFAVVSEYFFEQPDLLKENHPELYAILERMFIKKKINL